MRRLVVAWLAALLAGCGAGGGSTGPSSAAGISTALPETLRTDLLFGYYGGCTPYVVDESPHINLFWAGRGTGCAEGQWWVDMADAALAARAAGIRNIVFMASSSMVWGPNAAAEASFQLSKLAATKELVDFDSIAIYLQDEPDLQGKSDAEVLAAIANYRAAFATIPAFAFAKLAVIYSCASGQTPGISGFDWVGCDDYNRGCGALNELPTTLPGQRLLVVPGGASPWRQDPSCFIGFAENDPRVVAVIPFLWQDADGHGGISANGMRGMYCRAGKTATRGQLLPTC